MRTSLVFAALLGMAAASQATILTFKANLTGDQESTPTGSPAFGNGVLHIDTDTLAYSGFVRWTGLTGTPSDSHIHVGVLGTSGSVIYGYGVAGAVVDGIYLKKEFSGTLVDKNPANVGGAGTTGVQTPAQQIANWFLTEKTYMNIHTNLFPAGEIRGQLFAAVPEPASMAALGLGVVALVRRRKSARR